MPTGRYKKRLLTDDQMVELYRQGFGCNAIAKQAGVCHAQVRKDLMSLGIVLRDGRPPSLARPLSDQELLELHAQGVGCHELAKRQGVSWRTMNRDLPVLEALKEASGFGKIFKWREEGDKMVAGKLAHCQAMWCLRWNSKQLRQALQRHGLCYNKMKLLPAAVLPPAKYMRGFVRGLVDGDGHLTLRANGDVIIAFSNHNDSLLNAVADYFGQVSGKRPNINASLNGKHLVKSVAASGPAAVAVAKDLYLTDTTSIALARKREKAVQFSKWVPKQALWDNVRKIHRIV